MELSLRQLPLFHDRVGLELHEPFRIDETDHLHHGVCRTDVLEELAVDRADGFPILDVQQKGARADHVGKACTGLGEGVADDFEAASRLSRRVAARVVSRYPAASSPGVIIGPQGVRSLLVSSPTAGPSPPRFCST